ACAEKEFEPVQAAADPAEPLPAPLPADGAVTAIAAGAGGPATAPPDDAAPPATPGLAVIPPRPDGGLVAVVAAAAHAAASAAHPAAAAPPATPGLPVTPPLPAGGLVAVDAAAAHAAETGASPVAQIGFADGGLPPLEDNPETGLAAAPAPAPPTASAAAPEPGAGPAQAAAAVRSYYDAIRAGDLGRAYAAWSDGGRASGRTPDQFAAAFRDAGIVAVAVGEPSRAEGAAGSQFVEVPVTVTSRDAAGREVRQVGRYVMRSSQVDGAPRGWYIASAELRELQP